jgi:hypothetical protein
MLSIAQTFVAGVAGALFKSENHVVRKFGDATVKSLDLGHPFRKGLALI